MLRSPGSGGVGMMSEMFIIVRTHISVVQMTVYMSGGMERRSRGDAAGLEWR